MFFEQEDGFRGRRSRRHGGHHRRYRPVVRRDNRIITVYRPSPVLYNPYSINCNSVCNYMYPVDYRRNIVCKLNCDNPFNYYRY